MKKHSIPLGTAIFLLIAGIFLGTIFTFGMQYWNEEVPLEACEVIERQIIDCDLIRARKSRTRIKQIAIDCANGERYFIDGVSSNKELQNRIAALTEQDDITLILHPNNATTVIGMMTENDTLLDFDETIEKLGNEATGFMFLGIFMYLCSIIGLYHIIRRKKRGTI